MDFGQSTGHDCSFEASVGLFFLPHIVANMSNEGLTEYMMGAAILSKADYQSVEAVHGSGMYFQQSSALVDFLHGVKPAHHIPSFKFPVAYFNGSEHHRGSENKWFSLCKDQ
jgi:hypothetical protein